MERNIVINKIRERIDKADSDSIFTTADFLDIASHDAARKALSRLTKEKLLVRVIRGIYKKPNFNMFIDEEVPASPDAVAKAIARNNNWNIAPKGDAAANILGLTTQVPGVYDYISDGRYKEFDYNGTKIVFSKRTNKDLTGYSYKTALIIEALQTLGAEKINNSIRKQIASKCSFDDFVRLNKEGIKARKWIYEEIKKISALGGYRNA